MKTLWLNVSLILQHVVARFAARHDRCPGALCLLLIIITALLFPNQAFANNPPSVSITTPANNSTVTTPGPATVTANASDTDGTVSSVTFYVRPDYQGSQGMSLGTDYTAPYEATWQYMLPGNYKIWAEATDNELASTTSAEIAVTAENTPPTVEISLVYQIRRQVVIHIDAGDANGTIDSLVIDWGDSSNPTQNCQTHTDYTHYYSPYNTQTYTITATANDNENGSAQDTLQVAIEANQPPQVTQLLVTPNPVATPGPATVSATVEDPDEGVITSVYFSATRREPYEYINLGTVYTAPYSISWTNMTPGTYDVYAYVMDDEGGSGYSFPGVEVIAYGPLYISTMDITAEQSNRNGTPVMVNAPTVSGGLPPVTVTSNPTPVPTTFPLGETTITWTATDALNNTATATQKITVQDTMAPSIMLPMPVTVEQTNRNGTPATLGQATVDDICDANPTLTNNAPTVFPLGTTMVTWTSTDASGNIATANQEVTVRDTVAPVVTAPANITVEQSNRNGTTVTLGQATATDLCDANPTISNDAPAVFPLGLTYVTWYATDASGNTGMAMQQVLVRDTVDPVVTPPADVTVEQTNLYGTWVTLTPPTVDDLCDANPMITNNAPMYFPLGDTTVTWTITDMSGNTATCTQTVTVEDTTPPTINTQDITTEQMTRDGTTVPLMGLVSDICDANPTVTMTGVPQNGLFPLGTTTITITATDASGNTTTGQKNIIVRDTTPPSIMPPMPLMVEQTDRNGTLVTLTQPTVNDICDSGPAITNDAPVSFPLGTTTVTWTVTDASGNTATTTQNVTVVDTTPPVITPPTEITAEQTSADGTPVTLTPPTVTDICDANPTITNNAPEVFPLGTTTVVWTVTDAAGNTATANQSVTIEDTTPPTVTAPDPVTVEQNTVDGTAVILPEGPTVVDICDADPLISNDAPGVFPLGDTTVTWTITDASGNTTTVMQTVTIEDTTPPVIDNRDINKEQTSLDGTEVVLDDIVSDICDANPTVVMTNGPMNNLFPLGQTIVTITATDASGNVATAEVKVIICDTTPPSISAPLDKTVTQTSPNGTAVDLGEPTVSDICDAEVTVTNDAPALFPLGITIVTWTATDDSGNKSTATQRVKIERGPEAQSYAVIKVFTNSTLTNEADGPIGGTVYPALEIHVAPGDAIASSPPSSLHIKENDVSLHALKETDIAFTGGWEKAVIGGGWEPATNIYEENQSTTAYVVYRKASESWVTTADPLGHNGNHTISADQVTFTSDGINTYTNGPSDVGAAVKNLIITNVTSNAGNSDYLIFEQGSNATVTFTIEDGPIGFSYHLIMWVRRTGEEQWNLQTMAEVGDPDPVTPTSFPATYTLNWDGMSLLNEMLNSDTYAFQLNIGRTDGFTVSDKTENTYILSHSARIRANGVDDTLELTYKLRDMDCIEPSELGADVVDDYFVILSKKRNLPMQLEPVEHVVDIYTTSDPIVYKPVMLGADNKAGEYHDHKNRRLIAVNTPAPSNPNEPIIAIRENSGYGNVRGARIQLSRLSTSAMTQVVDRRLTYDGKPPTNDHATNRCIREYYIHQLGGFTPNNGPGMHYYTSPSPSYNILNRRCDFLVALNGGLFKTSADGEGDDVCKGQLVGWVKDGSPGSVSHIYHDQIKRRFSLGFTSNDGHYLIDKDDVPNGTIIGSGGTRINTYKPTAAIQATNSFHSNLGYLICDGLPGSSPRPIFPYLPVGRRTDKRDSAWDDEANHKRAFIAFVWEYHGAIATKHIETTFIVSLSDMSWEQTQDYIIQTLEPAIQAIYVPLGKSVKIKDAIMVDGGGSIDFFFLRLPNRWPSSTNPYGYEHLRYCEQEHLIVDCRRQPSEFRVTDGDTYWDSDDTSTSRRW